jgi:hypothetical protein
MNIKRIASVALPAALLVFAFGLMNVSAQTAPTPELTVIKGATQSAPVTPSISDPATSLPAAPTVDPNATPREIPRRVYPRGGALRGEDYFALDPLAGSFSVSSSLLQRAFSAPVLNFPGQAFTGVNPSDNVGDVGPGHYVQMVNAADGSQFAIYNKDSGVIVQNPVLLNLLAPVDSACRVGALGDPIVLYDQFADRWLMSEFADEDFDDLAPFTMCVYISADSDPTGQWQLYAFDTNEFPDYPKFGVWHDAYYMTSNEASGPAIYAFDRDQMLAGQAATYLRIVAPPLEGFGFQALTPADADGDLQPPADTPGLLMRHRDDEMHNTNPNPTADFIEIWQYDVDFANPGNASLSGPINIQTSEFDSEFCTSDPNPLACIEQPGATTGLDAVPEVIMWRVQYRNFGAYQAMVGNFVTDVNDSDHAGIRWYEVRRGQNWVLHQEGTVTAADDVNRWMGSIAMDKYGNIALGYNISSDTTAFPSIRYTGRLAADTLGQMTQGENVVINGTAANASFRWGDYNSMNVDPDDDCTFYFTGNYSPAAQWSTRIAAFRFDVCEGGGPTSTPGSTTTPGATSTPGATPTATGTGGPVITEEIIDNNSFEFEDSSGNPVLDPWVVKNSTGDKIKCNKDTNGDGVPDKIFARTGECAFRFKGVVGEASKLQQKFDATVEVFAPDDTLDLSAWVNAADPLTDAIIKLRVKYGDTTPTGKINVTISPFSDYENYTATYTVISENVTQIKLQFQNNTNSGKIYVDDVSIIWSLIGVSTRRDASGLIPLP